MSGAEKAKVEAKKIHVKGEPADGAGSVMPVPGGAARILNTTFVVPEVTESIRDYFERSRPLGSYCTIDVRLTPREVVRVVVEASIPVLTRQVNSYFRKQVEKLTVRDVQQFANKFAREYREGLHVPTMMGLAPHRRINASKHLNVFYLDDILHDSGQRPLVAALVAQILLERYTNRRSRVVVLQETYGEEVRRGFVVLVQSKINQEVLVIDPSGTFPRLKDKCLSNMAANLVVGPKTTAFYEVLQSDLQVHHPAYRWCEKKRRFSIFSGNDRELSFAVEGRTPAEKRFRREQKKFAAAADDELVPMEIGFHPFWRRLGHTTLRIGDSLFELSSKGWRSHAGGSDSPRAYLFNNPYFRHQYGLYKHVGMPPVSIAINVSVPKAKAAKLRGYLEELSAATEKDREKFSLFRNNCNQGIMRVLEWAGIPGFCSKGYLGFSSILSFRRLLLHPQLPVNGRYIYPLPGSEIDEANLRRWVPRLLYRHNTSLQEMMRALPSLGVDAVAFGLRRLSDIIFKVSKIRIWEGTDPYFMH